MNAAIHAVTRCALDEQWDVYGVRQGYVGLIEGILTPLNARSVGGIIQQGGTVLGSTRCVEFTTPEGRAKALIQLRRHQHIDGLVVIGGDGSQRGAAALSQMDVAVVGLASTIDNDLVGSDTTIGTDTALNIALEAIDRLETTASSHPRRRVRTGPNASRGGGAHRTLGMTWVLVRSCSRTSSLLSLVATVTASGVPALLPVRRENLLGPWISSLEPRRD